MKYLLHLSVGMCLLVLVSSEDPKTKRQVTFRQQQGDPFPSQFILQDEEDNSLISTLPGVALNRPLSRPAIRPQTRPAIRQQTRPAIRPQTRPAIRPQTRPAIRPQTRPAIRPQARPAIRPIPLPAPIRNVRPAEEERVRPASLQATRTRGRPRPRPIVSTSTTRLRPILFNPPPLVALPALLAAGEPGVDFPNNTVVPSGLSFSCEGRLGGFYSDPEAGCQVYHQCLTDGRHYSHICGIGTIFNQKTFVCDHWYNYRCEDAETDYRINQVALYDEQGRPLYP